MGLSACHGHGMQMRLNAKGQLGIGERFVGILSLWESKKVYLQSRSFSDLQQLCQVCRREQLWGEADILPRGISLWALGLRWGLPDAPAQERQQVLNHQKLFDQTLCWTARRNDDKSDSAGAWLWEGTPSLWWSATLSRRVTSGSSRTTSRPGRRDSLSWTLNTKLCNKFLYNIHMNKLALEDMISTLLRGVSRIACRLGDVIFTHACSITFTPRSARQNLLHLNW